MDLRQCIQACCQPYGTVVIGTGLQPSGHLCNCMGLLLFIQALNRPDRPEPDLMRAQLCNQACSHACGSAYRHSQVCTDVSTPFEWLQSRTVGCCLYGGPQACMHGCRPVWTATHTHGHSPIRSTSGLYGGVHFYWDSQMLHAHIVGHRPVRTVTCLHGLPQTHMHDCRSIHMSTDPCRWLLGRCRWPQVPHEWLDCCRPICTAG